MKRKSCQFIEGGEGILFASREVCNDSVERFAPPAPLLCTGSIWGVAFHGLWEYFGNWFERVKIHLFLPGKLRNVGRNICCYLNSWRSEVPACCEETHSF